MQAEQPTVYSLHDTMYGRINVDPRQSVLFWHHLEDLCMFPNKVLVSCCPSVAQGVKPFSTEGACGNKIQQRPLRKNLPSTAVPEREKKSLALYGKTFKKLDSWCLAISREWRNCCKWQCEFSWLHEVVQQCKCF